MKRTTLCFSLILCLMLPTVAACAEPLGWGIVNTDAVNFRKAPNGDRLYRMNTGDTVYVKDTKLDARNRLWYYVIHELANSREKNAWVLSDYVDVGTAAFGQVKQAAASSSGMMTLGTDGMVRCAAYPHYSYPDVRGVTSRWTDVVQVYCGIAIYGALLADGTLLAYGRSDPAVPGNDTRVRLATLGHSGLWLTLSTQGQLTSQVAALSDNAHRLPDAGRVVQLDSMDVFATAVLNDGSAVLIGDAPSSLEAEIAKWRGLAKVECAYAAGPSYADYNSWVLMAVGLKQDGTVVAWPERFAQAVSGWTDVIDVQACNSYILALKRDGTVLAYGDTPDGQGDVQGWQDVASIAISAHYCVGIKNDGSLLYAGYPHS